jgi:hypothetical protein
MEGDTGYSWVRHVQQCILRSLFQNRSVSAHLSTPK